MTPQKLILWCYYGIGRLIQQKKMKHVRSLAENQPVPANWWGDISQGYAPMTPYKSF